MRVLGIDCGTERTGYGVIESDGRSHRMIAAGAIHTSPKDPLEARLLAIAQRSARGDWNHSPDSAAVEEVFYAQNVKTALKLAHVRGVALLAIAEAGLGAGRIFAARGQNQRGGLWPRRKAAGAADGAFLAGLGDRLESEDACDALAVAICHATHAAFRLRSGGTRDEPAFASRCCYCFCRLLRPPRRGCSTRSISKAACRNSRRSQWSAPARPLIRKPKTTTIPFAFS